jgi:hypothetical protein
MASIFHYTDASGLVGILSSRSMFATHYRSLNDSTEATVIHDLIMPILEADVAEVTPQLVKRGWLKEEFYKQYGASGHLLQAESIYDSIARTIDNVSPFFVLSFCRHDEESDHFQHGLLSQWRGYAGGGGVAIEFDEQGIDAAMSGENSKFVYGTTKTADVLYDNFERIFQPDKFKGLAGAMIGMLFGERDISEITGHKNIDEAVRDFISVAPFLKNVGFREEREYRMVLSPVRKSRVEGEPGFKGGPKPIKFRTRKGSIIPYIEVSEFTGGTLPIKSIVVGPHPHQNIQRDAVAMLLESNGIEADIRLSQIPFLSTKNSES